MVAKLLQKMSKFLAIKILIGWIFSPNLSVSASTGTKDTSLQYAASFISTDAEQCRMTILADVSNDIPDVIIESLKKEVIILKFTSDELINVSQKLDKGCVLLWASPEIDLLIMNQPLKVTSQDILWYIIDDADIQKTLQKTLVPERQIRIASVTSQRLVLKSSYIAADNTMHFEVMKTARIGELDYSQPRSSKLMNFHGRTLIVAANNQDFFTKKTLENGNVVPDFGVDVMISNILSETLNFSYVVTAPDDGSWGGPHPDGTISGLIGLVARREADFAIHQITVTEKRETVIDFTRPYLMDRLKLLQTRPKQKNRSTAILAPFHLEVWIAIPIALIIMGIGLFVAGRTTEWNAGKMVNLNLPLHKSMFLTFALLFKQPIKFLITYSSPRIILICWIFFALIVGALYSSILTSTMTIPSFEKPIDDLQDVIDASRSRGVKFGMVGPNTAIGKLLNESSFSLYKELWSEMSINDMVGSAVDGYRKTIRVDMYVHLTSEINLRSWMKAIGKYYAYAGKDSFFYQGYGIACPSGAPYRSSFDHILLSLVESGIIEKLLLDSEFKIQEKHLKYLPELDETATSGKLIQNEPLSTDHLQGCFYVYFIGVLVATFTLIFENLVFVVCKNVG